MALGADAGVVVECRQRDAVLVQDLRIAPDEGGVRLGPIQDGRAAYPAEPAAIARARFVIRQQVFALDPAEIAARYPRPRAEGGALLFPAPRTVAVQRPQQRAGDLELDAAAQAASMQRHHILPCKISPTLVLLKIGKRSRIMYRGRRNGTAFRRVSGAAPRSWSAG